jgi:hypothetical protein
MIAVPIRVLVLLASGAFAVPSHAADVATALASSALAPGAIWAISVYSPTNQLIGSLTVRLTDKTAKSCMGGDWKRLDILKWKSTDPNFVASRPMSYLTNGSDFTFGANEVCDAYLWLKGRVDSTSASGSYLDLSVTGSESLGTFTAIYTRLPGTQ